MLSVTLVRHGQTAWNDERRCQGQSDTPLSELGIVQAQRVAQALSHEQVDAIYSSDLQRTRVTAELIAAYHNLAVHVDLRLREMNLGECEGIPYGEVMQSRPEMIARWEQEPANVVWPGGESLEQLQARALPAFEDILQKHAAGNVVVVAHQLTLYAILTRLLGTPLNDYRRFLLETGGITRIEVNGRYPGPVVRSLNDTTHLGDAVRRAP